MENSQTPRFLHRLVCRRGGLKKSGVILGVPKMVLGVPESKFRDYFSTQTSPQNLQKATSGTIIGPQKSDFQLKPCQMEKTFEEDTGCLLSGSFVRFPNWQLKKWSPF